MTVTDTETFGSEWVALERLKQLRQSRHILGYRMYLDDEAGEIILTYTWEKDE